ncbi:MAG: ADP-ribosylglycohydrolase family protein [bacterium]
MDKTPNTETLLTYSQDMLALIRACIAKVDTDVTKVEDALSVWTYKYPTKFVKKLETLLNLKIPRQSALKAKNLNQHITKFKNDLLNDGKKHVFLLNDAKVFYPGNDSTRVLKMSLSRKNLGSQENYLKLFSVVNSAALQAKNWKDFIQAYSTELGMILESNSDLRALHTSMTRELRAIVGMEDNICFVDTGLQATFALFLMDCYLQVKADVKSEIKLFCVYPWLSKLFVGRAYTSDASLLFHLEQRMERSYHNNDPLNKIGGALVGFAVGDSLGFPAAGIEGKEFIAMNRGRIEGFQTNAKHPYFSHLNAGYYTDNTRMLTDVTKDLIKDGGYNVDSRVDTLIKWAKDCQDKEYARWPGPTSLSAANKLRMGVAIDKSGSTNTESCSSIYRVIPIGLFFNDINDIAQYSEMEASLTHNSSVSKAANVFIAILIHYLQNNENPQSSAQKSLEFIITKYGSDNKRVNILVKNIQQAIRGDTDVKRATVTYGTGSPVWQTVPLALFYFLSYPSIFAKPILLSANSYRQDTVEEKKRLTGLSWDKQLIEARGGNTDGIAGITGALIGAYNGLNVVDSRFRKVEDFDLLIEIANKLESNASNLK